VDRAFGRADFHVLLGPRLGSHKKYQEIFTPALSVRRLDVSGQFAFERVYM